MKRIKLFTADSHDKLELEVNHWLQEHKDITVLSADLEMSEKKDPQEYLFYILYSAIVEADEKGKLQTLAVVDQSAASAESNKVVEVITNPEVTIKN